MGRKVCVDVNQISIFDIIDEESLKKPEIAISMFDGQEHTVYPLKSWMANLLPEGEYYVLCAGHPLVLCRSDEDVPPEMRYRHYKIGNKVYAATGVGRDDDFTEEEQECSCEE